MKRAHFGPGTADAGTPGMHMGHGRTYDVLHQVLFGGRRRRVFTRLAALSGARPGDGVLDVGCIAADVAAVAPDGGHVLEVGCGPGRLSIRLARRHALGVTGLDLDPAMIERARRNVDRPKDGDGRRPSFLVGDVASLAFPDGSFDLVVSTLSMHHWADPTAGLAEIGRVLRPGGRALVWDFQAGPVPLHGHLPDPGRTCSRLPVSRGRRNAMAVALPVQPHPADRARAHRRRASRERRSRADSPTIER